MAKALILTHIFGKSLDKGIAKAEIISISTMAIVLPGSFTKSICKMWVKDRAKAKGLLRSPTCGTYPPGLTWATSWPVRSLQSQRKAGGHCPSQRLAHRTLGSLVLLPKRAYLGTGKHYSVVSVLKNSSILAACKVDVNMLSCDDGQTYDQTYHGSLGTARQGSYPRDQATLWMPFRCGSHTVGDQDGSQAGGSPFHPTPTRNAASIPVTLRQGVLRRGLIK